MQCCLCQDSVWHEMQHHAVWSQVFLMQHLDALLFVLCPYQKPAKHAYARVLGMFISLSKTILLGWALQSLGTPALVKLCNVTLTIQARC